VPAGAALPPTTIADLPGRRARRGSDVPDNRRAMPISFRLFAGSRRATPLPPKADL
jgi:hypothetical protein